MYLMKLWQRFEGVFEKKKQLVELKLNDHKLDEKSSNHLFISLDTIFELKLQQSWQWRRRDVVNFEE